MEPRKDTNQDDDEEISSHCAKKFIKRHEAINVALMDIAALERLVKEECPTLPREVLLSLSEDFQALDDLQREMCAGLEECSAAKCALARRLSGEKEDRARRLENKRLCEAENARRIEELSSEMEALAEQAARIDAEIKRLRQEALQACQRKRSEKKRWERGVGRLTEVVRENKLRRQAELSAARGLQELQDNCVKLGEEVQDLRSCARREAKEHERQKEESEERLAELSARLQAQRAQNLELQEELKKVEEEAERVGEEAALTEEEANVVERQLEHAEERIQEMQAEHERQASRKKQIEETIQDLKEKITALDEKDFQMQKDTEREISQLSKQIAERSAELDGIQALKKSLSEELERVKALAGVREAEAARVGEESRRLEAEVERRQDEVTAARQELERLQTTSDELRREDTEWQREWERECTELRAAARHAKERLEPAKRRLRGARSQLQREQRRTEQKSVKREERIRHARRQLQLEHVMIGSLERMLRAANGRKEALALHQALLHDADKMAAVNHASRMEAQWHAREVLKRAEHQLLRGVAALEVAKERIRAQTDTERKFLQELLDDIAALSEHAYMLQQQKSDLQDEIFDYQVTLDAQGIRLTEEELSTHLGDAERRETN